MHTYTQWSTVYNCMQIHFVISPSYQEAVMQNNECCA